MTPLKLLIAALATWRLTDLLVIEDGPLNAFARLRYAAGIRYDDYSQPRADTLAGQALLCPRCTSVWVGLALTVALALHARAVWLLLPFGLSAVAIALEALIRRLETA